MCEYRYARLRPRDWYFRSEANFHSQDPYGLLFHDRCFRRGTSRDRRINQIHSVFIILQWPALTTINCSRLPAAGVRANTYSFWPRLSRLTFTGLKKFAGFLNQKSLKNGNVKNSASDHSLFFMWSVLCRHQHTTISKRDNLIYILLRNSFKDASPFLYRRW